LWFLLFLGGWLRLAAAFFGEDIMGWRPYENDPEYQKRYDEVWEQLEYRTKEEIEEELDDLDMGLEQREGVQMSRLEIGLLVFTVLCGAGLVALCVWFWM
jgi:hypothetical protein